MLVSLDLFGSSSQERNKMRWVMVWNQKFEKVSSMYVQVIHAIFLMHHFKRREAELQETERKCMLTGTVERGSVITGPV
jgi:hypothetical protein